MKFILTRGNILNFFLSQTVNELFLDHLLSIPQHFSLI